MPGIESRIASKRLGAHARSALIAVARDVQALLVDRSQALVAAMHADLPRTKLSDLRAAYTAAREPSDDRNSSLSSAPLQGQLLRVSERREVAIYLRNDAIWVADFIDGHGEIVDAPTWFRFNCGTPHSLHSQRRMSLESAIPLSAQLAARIESLHRRLPEDAAR